MLHTDRMTCLILKTTVNIDLAPADVIAIHRVPGGARKGQRTVIAKFRDTETKVKVIKNRSQDKLKYILLCYI